MKLWRRYVTFSFLIFLSKSTENSGEEEINIDAFLSEICLNLTHFSAEIKQNKN